MGHLVLGDVNKHLHLAGLRNLASEINAHYSFEMKIEENVSPDKFNHCNVVYVAGTGGFELSAKQQAEFEKVLKSGGTIFDEGCARGDSQGRSKGAKEFGLAFNQLASQLGCKLESVQPGHKILTAGNIFTSVPDGSEAGMMLEGSRMIYSGSDYGCAWEGGDADHMLSRESIRCAVEIGANIVLFGRLQ
jgi:hypothetical protein